jgi:hypothetical protein
MRNLKHLRLEYQILYYTEEGSVTIEVFDNAEKALDFTSQLLMIRIRLLNV